jgi:thioredoxin-like negative regulator of GroEL
MRTSFFLFWQTVLVWVGLGFGGCFAETMMVFSADWCGNCVKFKKDLERQPFALEPNVVDVLDFDADRETARQLNVTRIPTFILYDENNREVARKVGYANISELKAWADKHAK